MTKVWIYASIVLLLMPLACVAEGDSFPGFAGPSTLNLEKALAKCETSWTKHAFLPTEETIEALEYSGDVEPEKEELWKFLQKILKEDQRPTYEKLMANTQPLVGLWKDYPLDTSDYLLLKYTTKSGKEVFIQDGRKLYILFLTGMNVPLNNIESLVKDTAERLFDAVSAKAPKASNPKIGICAVDIGDSKSGSVDFGPAPGPRPDWYSPISWWSDGSSVLFLISKADFKKLATMQFAPPFRPRIFKSRAVEVPTEDQKLWK